MSDLNELYKRYLDGYCTRQELEDLLRLVSENEDSIHMVLDEEFEQALPAVDSQTDEILSQNLESLIERIRLEKEDNGTVISMFRKNKRLWYVAASIFLITLFSFLYVRHQIYSTDSKSNSLLAEIYPATEQATLTLDDGTAYALNDLEPGQTFTQDGITFMIEEDGSLSYASESIEENDSEAEIYHTMTTPKGGTYRINLPDKSTIWLNTSSTVRYPIRFKKSQRVVFLDEGEAFFDVAHMSEKPFRVQTKQETIEVLGTQFNISAYSTSDIVTTLVSGRVKLTHHSNEKELVPNQQAIWKDGGFLVKTVDVSPYVSWQSGWFIFHNTPLLDVLKELEKWYNIEVDYSNLPNRTYYAEINRHLPLSQVLDMIQANSKTTFEMKGGKLYVK